MNSPLLRLEGLAKTFPNGTVALRGVNLEVLPGQVHGLLGANGAGKSTLIKMLSGALGATGGEIFWRGSPVSWRKPGDARQAGVATIHQHIPLIPTLSVLENVFIWQRGFLRDSQDIRDRFSRLSQTIGYQIDPDRLVSELTIGECQMVAIFSALAGGADLLVMDEPTASLANEEREIVYNTVKRLARQEKKAILFVSHFLDEITDLTDVVTVLRDGVAVLHTRTDETDQAGIAQAIVGRKLAAIAEGSAHSDSVRADVVLSVEGLGSPGRLDPLHFQVRAGEVVGVAGFLGSGRSELLHAIFGADRSAVGTVRFKGKELARGTGNAVREGMALVPEDRSRQGLVPGFEIFKNISLAHLDGVARYGFIDSSAERDRGSAAIEKLKIKAQSPDSFVTELSGGNAQKVVVGKWLFEDIGLLLLDEPTAGIDVGAKADILELVRSLAATGVAVVIVSSEFEEILAVAHRVLVLRDGRLVAEKKAKDVTEHDLVLLSGGRPAESDLHSGEVELT
ncbi:sugar ABC transporter ATP-binding protein [Rhizobium sp. Root1204]|uniref:sugar ABC transporter ATP-binding protein n=1 Tax=Rhizobium sp. Root1204 TaxID=1736428 RepID=UPI000716141A|nr:sugar ABC transporter ATP-binding protein [Rhizobium sp. Root1204]KQV37033.1 sugar ABC transporter ATP-binding protein [Rhizobium sp. Root1204]